MVFGGTDGDDPSDQGDRPDIIDADHAVKKLLENIKNGSITIFDKEEAAALQDMARLWLSFRVVGRFANVVRKIIIWLAWPIVLLLIWKSHGLTGVLDAFQK